MRIENILILISAVFASETDLYSKTDNERTFWNLIPQSLTDIINMNVNIFQSLPNELYSMINKRLCSNAVDESVPLQITPDISKMKLQYISPCLNHTVPLLKADDLWSTPSFYRNNKLVILATGWNMFGGNLNAKEMMARAFNCWPSVNFVFLDAANYVDTLYAWSAVNTKLIGKHVARGLRNLIKVKPTIKIHLIGHSLGAHIMGAAGRAFEKYTGQQVDRITGLDPAKPCFRHERELYGLKRGDAKIVDVIHTNSDILGQLYPMGDIDFYPGGVQAIQPGCLTITCSHSRAMEYFAESVYPPNKKGFLGVKCNSESELKNRRCTSRRTSSMGYVINSTAKGNYYVQVNTQAPFGINSRSAKFVCRNLMCG